ncbi:protein ABHD15-like isoform X2 [Biomphalaria glabrata]|uniref:Protein ABHD15-like isoform X2 n=1 Tax=Biomphalaria glabrata TaxID=6526 RepID=A0A9W2YK72_BIOGL|nr:protein ABHD15-like isoform X2 [Biomphalaria glabrata]
MLLCLLFSITWIVKDKCKLTDRVFCSSKLFSNRHFQTLLPYILPKPEVTFEREYLQMHDKGVVALDWVTSCQERVKRRAPILLVIPPVTEGAAYVSNICFSGTERGFRVVVFNRRGEGGSYLTTPKLQSFCDPSDLTQAIEYVTLKVVGCPLAAVAYGTGCGMLMSYIGTSGSSSKLVARVCISPSYEAPSKSNCPIYDTILLLKLKCLVLRHMKALSSVLDISKVMSTWMLPEFSSSLYCPLYGCPSPSQLADAVKPVLGANSADVPLLCINGLDDPVCASAFLPYHTFQSRTNSLLVVTNKGGHCGFYHQLPPKSWSDSLSLDYILAVEEFNSRASRLPKQARIPFRATSAPGCLNMYCSTGDLRDRKVRSKESNLNTIHEKENVMESFPPKVYFE